MYNPYQAQAQHQAAAAAQIQYNTQQPIGLGQAAMGQPVAQQPGMGMAQHAGIRPTMPPPVMYSQQDQVQPDPTATARSKPPKSRSRAIKIVNPDTKTEVVLNEDTSSKAAEFKSKVQSVAEGNVAPVEEVVGEASHRPNAIITNPSKTEEGVSSVKGAKLEGVVEGGMVSEKEGLAGQVESGPPVGVAEPQVGVVLEDKEVVKSISFPVPKETVPEEVKPEMVPGETVPGEAVPKESVQKETVPEEKTVPKETLPEETVPEETVPKETVPEETVPKETVPEEMVCEEGKGKELSRAEDVSAPSASSLPGSTSNAEATPIPVPVSEVSEAAAVGAESGKEVIDIAKRPSEETGQHEEPLASSQSKVEAPAEEVESSKEHGEKVADPVDLPARSEEGGVGDNDGGEKSNTTADSLVSTLDSVSGIESEPSSAVELESESNSVVKLEPTGVEAAAPHAVVESEPAREEEPGREEDEDALDINLDPADALESGSTSANEGNESKSDSGVELETVVTLINNVGRPFVADSMPVQPAATTAKPDRPRREQNKQKSRTPPPPKSGGCGFDRMVGTRVTPLFRFLIRARWADHVRPRVLDAVQDTGCVSGEAQRAGVDVFGPVP